MGYAADCDSILCNKVDEEMSPRRPRTPCNYPGCPELVEPGQRLCPKHKRQERKRADEQRGNSNQRGYTYRWSKYSKWYLRQHPLCMCPECAALPVPLPAQVVDHIVPHRGDSVLFWDPNNHQAMNKRCHDRKTAREDGGFGRERKNESNCLQAWGVCQE